MAGRGPAPKPSHLRQRTNKKAGSATITAAESPEIPELPNPDGREWHPLTLQAWREWWESPMATQWLATDVAGLGMLAILYDNNYKTPHVDYVKEIRLQRPCFGLTPLDRSRLAWEISKADEAEQKTTRRAEVQRKRTGTNDPRHLLTMVKK